MITENEDPNIPEELAEVLDNSFSMSEYLADAVGRLPETILSTHTDYIRALKKKEAYLVAINLIQQERIASSLEQIANIMTAKYHHEGNQDASLHPAELEKEQDRLKQNQTKSLYDYLGN